MAPCRLRQHPRSYGTLAPINRFQIAADCEAAGPRRDFFASGPESVLRDDALPDAYRPPAPRPIPSEQGATDRRIVADCEAAGPRRDFFASGPESVLRDDAPR